MENRYVFPAFADLSNKQLRTYINTGWWLKKHLETYESLVFSGLSEIYEMDILPFMFQSTSQNTETKTVL